MGAASNSPRFDQIEVLRENPIKPIKAVPNSPKVAGTGTSERSMFISPRPSQLLIVSGHFTRLTSDESAHSSQAENPRSIFLPFTPIPSCPLWPPGLAICVKIKFRPSIAPLLPASVDCLPVSNRSRSSRQDLRPHLAVPGRRLPV